ncbi:MAG: peptidyl-prolyl cis-trans isomerase [Deltaproteobacteria bacterium]|nr:peptidyl-prolyl cis-trans isomerase [Deltaproteobacteria bacterium]
MSEGRMEGARSVEPGAGRARALFALGATLGLVLAAGSLLSPGSGERSELPTNAVAAVNGEVVRVRDYERALAALAMDRRNEVGETEKRRVLDRLIEEELLIQHAIELGLVRSDRRVRADLVSALIQSVVSEAATLEATRAQTEAFYQENLDYFTQPGRVRTRQILVRLGESRSAEEALKHAREITRRLRAGEPFAEVKNELGDREIARLPDGLLPPTKLREYLGPTAARTVIALELGAVSDPVRTAGGFRVLQLLEREPERTPPLREIQTEVLAEFRRQAGDRALRSYLDELRARAEIQIAETHP